VTARAEATLREEKRYASDQRPSGAEIVAQGDWTHQTTGVSVSI